MVAHEETPQVRSRSDRGAAGGARFKVATTYEGGHPEFLQRVLPLVDCLEVTPDSISEVHEGEARLHEPTLAELELAAREAELLVHGVGLSIGSHDGWSRTYIALLEAFLDRLSARWHSEHLAYTRVDGVGLGTMLALPKTEEALELVCRRVERLQERYRLPFLIENVVHVLPDAPGDYSEAGFLNALTARTGCGLILDLYNLECDEHNHGFAIEPFLVELDLAPVRELHLACGVEHDGFLLDVHSNRLRDSTLELARRVLGEAPNVEVVTYELLEEAIPVLGAEAVAEELVRVRQLVDEASAVAA